jgi:hypothetical protein
MLKRMKLKIDKELKNCRGIIYETASPEAVSDAKSKQARKARDRLFKMYVKRLGYIAYDICIDYIAPRLSLEQDDYYEEERLTLSFISLKKTYPNNIISKDEVIEILHFIYIQLYGDRYKNDKEKNEKYHEYLSFILETYKDILPENIRLKV